MVGSIALRGWVEVESGVWSGDERTARESALVGCQCCHALLSGYELFAATKYELPRTTSLPSAPPAPLCPNRFLLCIPLPPLSASFVSVHARVSPTHDSYTALTTMKSQERTIAANLSLR